MEECHDHEPLGMEAEPEVILTEGMQRSDWIEQ